MKILFLTDNFPPETNAPAARTYEHCVEWIKQGAEVTVITCAPNFPEGKLLNGYKNRLYQTEDIDGIKVVRVWSYMSRNAGFLKRTLDYLSFGMTAFLAGLFHRFDIIVATSPQIFTTFAGYGLSLLKRRPWVFELRDLWPESIHAVGAMKQSSAMNALERSVAFLYRRADRIVALTDAFKRTLVASGIEESKINVVTNGVSSHEFYPRDKNEELLAKLGLQDKFVVGYIGTHGMSHGLDFIVDSLAYLENKEIHFLFLGGGAERENVVAQAQSLGLKNVTFIPPVPRNEVPDYMGLIDAGLVPLRRNETFQTVIPSKIFELAAMKKPILLGVDGQARQLLDTYCAGLYFVPEDRDSFLEAANRIATDKDIYGQAQSGCEQLAGDYERDQLALKMLKILEDVAASR